MGIKWDVEKRHCYRIVCANVHVMSGQHGFANQSLSLSPVYIMHVCNPKHT